MQDDWHLAYVREVLEKTGLTATGLAGRAGIASTTLTRALNREGHKFKLSLTTLEKIRDATGVPFFGEGVVDSPSPTSLVPIYNVTAGAGAARITSDEYEIDRMAFPPGYLRRITKSDPKNLAIIGVKGDSMLPTLRDDDVVMVDLTKRDLSWGGIFVLRVDGDGLLVKRVSMGSQRGFFKIVSDNAAAFPPVERRAEDLEIIGRVIWYGVKV